MGLDTTHIVSLLTCTPFTNTAPDCSSRFAPFAQVFPAIPDATMRFAFVGMLVAVMLTLISGSGRGVPVRGLNSSSSSDSTT